ncbi:MAG: hypothetical protein JWP25_7718, partial [Bradyrhizobium sp.]|nr:hypothetical protein [Bradyrhizobium sp.]
MKIRTGPLHDDFSAAPKNYRCNVMFRPTR